MVRPRKAREERRQWGAENNDDERTRTRDFIAGERGASERDADAERALPPLVVCHEISSGLTWFDRRGCSS